MRKICFFNSIKSWGGGEKWHCEMAKFMSEKGYDVSFCLSRGSVLEEKIKRLKIKRYYVNVGNLSYLNHLKVKHLSHFFKDSQIEVLIVNSSEDMKFSGLAAKKAGISHIVYRRGSAIPIKNSFVNRYFFGQVITDMIANSAATKQTINQNNPKMFPLSKITVIPNGIDTISFLKNLNGGNNLNIDKPLVLGNLGRLVEQKNQVFLIEVARELKREGISFKMHIGGKGKLEKELKNKVKEEQLEHEVFFDGFIDNPVAFYEKIDVFLLSSLWEGFGYVIAEALLCQKPVIAFDTSSNPELIEHGKSGFLTKVNDTDAFVENIKKINKNRTLIQTFGSYGKEKMIATRDAKIAQEKFSKYINNLT